MIEMATNSQNGKSFFELLPAGIRDQIYDATMIQDMKREQVNFHFIAPCPRLRLVSPQFKDEYDARSIWGKYLDASLRQSSAKRMRAPDAPGLASRFISIQLNCLLGKHLLGRKWSDMFEDQIWQGRGEY